MMYADYAYYSGEHGGALPQETAERALARASDCIDILTYDRIEDLSALTEFQRRIVRKCVCSLTDWQESNADALSSPYKQYSVNGVSAAVGAGDTVKVVCGVMIPAEIWALLCTTGLCYGGV